jgi:uncharacterized membrane protein
VIAMPHKAYTMDNAQRAAVLRWLVGLSFIAVGVEHFRDPNLFVGIVPSYLPSPLALVYLSGVFEILGGAGLLIPRFRRLAGIGLLALLVAVYPANIHMLVNDVYLDGMAKERWILWVRMPLQFVFAAGVLVASELWVPARFRGSEADKHQQRPDDLSASL